MANLVLLEVQDGEALGQAHALIEDYASSLGVDLSFHRAGSSRPLRRGPSDRLRRNILLV